MTTASVPVDLFNPGQVFACLGLMELSELLCGDSAGGFDWSDPADVRFVLTAEGEDDPITAGLERLAATIARGRAARARAPAPRRRSEGDMRGKA